MGAVNILYHGVLKSLETLNPNFVGSDPRLAANWLYNLEQATSMPEFLEKPMLNGEGKDEMTQIQF